MPPKPRASDLIRDKIRDIENAARFARPATTANFNENDYSQFDSDAVRPNFVPLNEALHDTAIAHESEVIPSYLPDNEVFHRAAMHSDQSLPAYPFQPKTSAAADAPRQRNAETAKIVNSEHLTKEMRRSDDAIAYFARTPDKATVKLVFCKPTSNQADRIYNPYSLDVVCKQDTEILPVYYTISQNGVMRIVNEEAAKKIDFSAEISQLREGKIEINTNGPKIIYKKVTEDEDTESLLSTKKSPELTDTMFLTKKCNVLSAFLEDSTEFVQLDRWILESSSFNILRNFKFFREFYARKSLENWIAFRKFKKFCRNRAFQQYNLFVAKGHFLTCLQQINEVLVQIRDNQVIDSFATFEYENDNYSKNKSSATPTNNIKAWNDSQNRVQSHITSLIENANESILTFIMNLCAELHKHASDKTDEENAKLPLFLKQKMLKSKSITQTKAEQLDKRKAVRTAQNELKSIYKLIQLVDQLFIEVLLQMLQNSCQQLSININTNKEIRPSTSNGVIQSEISFNSENELFFEPSLDVIHDNFIQTINNTISLCNKPNQLSKFEALKEYFILGQSEQRNGSQTIVQISANDYEFQDYLSQIESHIAQQTQELKDRSNDYNELQPLWIFLSAFNEKEYSQQQRNLSCNIKELLQEDFVQYALNISLIPSSDIKDDVENAIENARNNYGTRPLEREIAKFRSWQAKLGKQAPAIPSGFAQLDARSLLQKLQPVPITGLKAVENTALTVMSEIRTDANDKIQAHIKAISQQPSELEAYSAFIKYLETVDVDLEILIQKVQLCDDIMQLLTSQNLIQTQVPQALWTNYNKGQSLDELYAQDAKLNPPILGLGLKLNIQDRSDLEALHTSLNILQQKRSQAENFAQQIYQSQVNNMISKVDNINKSTGDVQQQLISGPSTDQNAEPTQVIINLKELIQKVENLEQDTEEIAGHSGVINNWLETSEKKKKKQDKNQDHKVNPITENIDSTKLKIKGFQTDLQTRLSLWERLNEWKIFEQYLIYDPWITVCFVGVKQEEQEEEEVEDEKEHEEEVQEDTQEPDESLKLLLKFKEMNVENSVSYVSEVMKDANKFTRLLNDDPVAVYYKQSVTQMRHKSQLLMDLGNTAMDDVHWQEIFDLIDGQQYSYTSQFTLFNLLKSGVLAKKGEVAAISAKATGEFNLKKQLTQIQKQWQQTKFKCKEYAARSNPNSLILNGVDDLFQQLDDSLAIVQSMSGSRFIAGIREQVNNMEKQLTDFSDILDEWVKCQQGWLYLESIFAPPDIKAQLPAENEIFQEVDRFWHSILEQAKKANSVLDVSHPEFKVPGQQESILVILQNHNESLEKVQKRLEDYLETKRLAFPRFYFISNDELLQILAQTTDVGTVRPFLRKIFEALSDFTLETIDGQVNILDMISPEGEHVIFEDKVVPEGGLVEVWLNALEHEMFNTLRVKQMRCLQTSPAYGAERKQWIFEHPAQCILAGGQCVYTDAVENALYDDAQLGTRYMMEQVKDTMITQIEELSELIINTQSAIQRKIITPIIVLEVFSRDVCYNMLDKTCDAYSQLPSDFGWQKQLRHYWTIEGEQSDDPKFKNTGAGDNNFGTGELELRQTDFKFISGYEYYGVNMRLVVTPLTTKCYLTLTSAISRGFGGNPLGPAGTGKTETSKDLIKTLQVSCLIFNCSDGLDHKSMAKFFCGLAMSGSFSVFDEFNRILIDTLSVISQQILTIQNAVRAKKKYFTFEQHAELKLNCRVGFFITYNPDYGGRTELPESVKALFRPIAMIVPDYALIAENFLFSEGYKNGKVLSRKMTQLYKLSSEQLSQQFHYDFGMRAIKSILYMAGRLKATSTGNESEDNLLIRAMLDSNIPKFLADDIDLFNGIVQDLFPGLEMPATNYGALEAEVKKCLVNRGLQANPEFVVKILQAYDTHVIRHGQMFVGETLTGKTIARQVLAEAITNLAGTQPQFLPVEEHLLSAKSITMAELYGELNLITNDWTDGLIAVLARKILTDLGKKHFIVFDSPVDPIWIENLNTVLDDSKMFCLANGERIRLNDYSNIMVEVADLSQASPATVSRCGMVYFSSKFLSNEIIFRSLTIDSISFMTKLFNLIVMEEFNIILLDLREKYEDLAAKKVFDDEPDTPYTAVQPQELTRIETELLGSYPDQLKDFLYFEQVALRMTMSIANKLVKQFIAIFNPLIELFRLQYQEEIQTYNFQQVINVVHVLESLINERIAFSKQKIIQENEKNTKAKKKAQDINPDTQIEQLSAKDEFLRFLPNKTDLDERMSTGLAPITSILIDQRLIFSLAWGFGGTLKSDFTSDFDKQIRQLVRTDREGLTQEQIAALMSLTNNMPPTEASGSNGKQLTIFDWKIDNQSRYYSQWNPENKMFGSSKFNYNIILQGGSIYDMIVPTTQFVKICTVVQSLLRSNANVYLCGSTGTSKTSIVKTVFSRTVGAQSNEDKKDDKKEGEGEQQAVQMQDVSVDYFLEQSPLDASVQELPFSAQTKAVAVENAIFEKLDKKRKNLFAPSNGRSQHYIFIDDADMPTYDKFGAQPPNELIRQLSYQGGCYDRQKLTFKQVEGLQFIYASQQPGAGRNYIDPRLTSKFVVLSCPEVSNQAMNSIFNSLLTGFFGVKINNTEFTAEVKNTSKLAVAALVDLYNEVRTNIRATPLKSHYSFNLRDVARVIGGIFAVKPKEIATIGNVLSLLIHESQRVFRDRLTDGDDEEIFDNLLYKTFISYFKPAYDEIHKEVVEGEEVHKDEQEEEIEDDEDRQAVKVGPDNYGTTPQEWNDKLVEIAGCQLDSQSLLFGRWTNQTGVTPDIAPYKNLNNNDEEQKQALVSILNSVYDEEPEDQSKDEIDFEILLNQKEDTNLRLVLFKDAISHFSRLFRVLSQPAGHSLCIGLSGSGRKSLLKLVATAIEASIVEPTASRMYGLNELYDELKRCFLITADQGDKFKPIVLLLTETSLDSADAFLEVINGVLNGVPLPITVWKKEEIEKVKEIAQQVVSKEDLEAIEGGGKKKDYTNAQLWDVFYRTARANFHVCLCFSPVGEKLRKRLRQFPALVNCTTIDWYTVWNNEALLEVAKSFLQQVHKVLFDKYTINEIAKTCVSVHDASNTFAQSYFAKTKTMVYVTPPMFISFLQLFKSILQKSVGGLKQRDNILSKGLTKLTETSEQVAGMKVQLTELQPVLAESVAATEKLLEKLSVEQEEAGTIRVNVEAEGKEVAKIVASAQEIKDDVEADLAEAMPAYLSAMKALQNFDKNSVTELKSFKQPPIAVKQTLEAVLTLFESPKIDWDSALKLVQDMNFISRVMNFDKDHMKPKVLRALRKYTQNPDFTIDKVENSSKAAKCLYQWCQAMDVYAKVASEVEPKKLKLEGAEAELDKQQKALAVKQKELAEVEAKLADLQKTYEDSVNKRTQLENQIKETELRLTRAEQLVNGLKSEHESWKVQISQISDNMKSSVGDALLGSAIIAYLGPYTSDERKKIILGWKENVFKTIESEDDKIFVSQAFTLDTYSATADPREIRKWKQKCQLPGDSGSIQSAIIVTASKRYPFLIDPELQGINWLKKMLEHHKLVGANIDTMARDLENAITTGAPFVVENATEDLDSTLSSVLRKEIARNMIKVGDKSVSFNPTFALYLTTRKRKIDLSPDIQASASVINMSVSSEGLEEQLLSLVLQVEDPQSELSRDEAAGKLADAKDEQQKQQDTVLEMLANSTGNILDDSNLINALQQSKEVTERIVVTIGECEESTKISNQKRELYREVAIRGRILYEAIAGLSTLDPMYTYSIDFFKNLFTKTLQAVPQSNNKVYEMIKSVTETCFIAVCRGIFERHKPVFAFMIASGIQRQNSELSSKQWEIFTNDTLVKEVKNSDVDEEFYDKLSDALSLKQINRLVVFTNTAGISEKVLEILQKKAEVFKEFCKYETIESYPTFQFADIEIATLYNEMSPFQKLNFLKIINPIRLLFYLPIYTRSVMQDELYVSPPNFNMADAFSDCSSIVPLIFVLSAGSDPMLMLQQYVHSQEKTHKFFTLALGQGQGVIADGLLERAIENGEWVCLQNCHLCESWMPQLQKHVEKLQDMNTSGTLSADFRLIMTSMPSRIFPSSVLAQSIKISNEPPRGVKQNILMSYQVMAENYHNEMPDEPKLINLWKRSLFCLSFFYSSLLERRRFGPVCYNSKYDFTIQDIQISQKFIYQYLVDSFAVKFAGQTPSITQMVENVPYKPLCYMIGNVAFGGRISDALDTRCVDTIMSSLLNTKLFDEKRQMCVENQDYTAPDFSLDYKQVMEYIQKNFPIVEKPSLFGLNDNAELTYQQTESNNIIESILSMMPTDSVGEGTTVAKIDQKVLIGAEEILQKIPADLDINSVKMPLKIKLQNGNYMPSPLSSVLRQECARYNKLLKIIRQLFADVQLAVKGLAIMSSELDEIYQGILGNKLPNVVKAASFPTLKNLSSYVTDLVKRVEFFRNWANMCPSEEQPQRQLNEFCQNKDVQYLILGQLDGYIPTQFWLGAFHFPHGFFTGILQHHARVYALSIDRLSFQTNAVNTDEQVNTIEQTLFDGVLLTGLKSEGCQWNFKNEHIDESDFGKILTDMPAIWFRPVLQIDNTGKYAMPLYTTTNRFGVLTTTGLSSNYVMNMNLPSKKEGNWWIQRGAAAFIQDPY
ncbi:Dynein heavy chain [Spironucleus salmonicida]|uniref:Dynein heavy chain n=1 Tax=Spironucleus salmonicida TaxID=348837 RepID=V6LE55_9EUKA|nr:Dynein heavy chain [Spironucleus salmonicida]|eukprot:EST41976.1 Dynein heavy chain [Spironucleus salmonicida]